MGGKNILYLLWKGLHISSIKSSYELVINGRRNETFQLGNKIRKQNHLWNLGNLSTELMQTSTMFLARSDSSSMISCRSWHFSAILLITHLLKIVSLFILTLNFIPQKILMIKEVREKHVTNWQNKVTI